VGEMDDHTLGFQRLFDPLCSTCLGWQVTQNIPMAVNFYTTDIISLWANGEYGQKAAHPKGKTSSGYLFQRCAVSLKRGLCDPGHSNFTSKYSYRNYCLHPTCPILCLQFGPLLNI